MQSSQLRRFVQLAGSTAWRWSRSTGVPLALAIVACGEPTSSPAPSSDPASPFIVSNPALAQSASARGGAANGGTSEDSVVFVSLRRGEVPDGTRASISNLSSGETVQVDLTDGGFDPVALHAVAGDRVLIEVAGSASPLRVIELVSSRRRPVVVRTDPPPRRRDVPLNKVIAVVFSEPIGPSALTDGAIELRRNGVPVPAQLAFTDAVQLAVELTPDALLANDTDYELWVSATVRDLGGDALAEPLVVPFTTEPAIATRLVFDIQPVASLSGVPLSAIRVSAVDAAGKPVLGFQKPITLTLAANASAAGLAGVVSVVGAGGVATFEHVRVTHSGRGLQIVASADGLATATSVAFDVASGGMIAFTSPLSFASDQHVFVLNLDGGTVTQLTSGAVQDATPAWSPDGSRMAFSRSADDGTGGTTGGVYVMNADGTGLTRLTAFGSTPAWSPDGTRIVFSGSGRNGLHVMNSDGSGVTQLTDGFDDHPAWSPDGTTIAFNRSIELFGDSWNFVYLMNADGSNVRRLTSSCTYTCGVTSAEGHPSWSPDGSKLTYWSFALGVTIIDRDATQVSSATRPGQNPSVPAPPAVWFQSNPDWSPDGRHIVFQLDGQQYLSRADGSISWVPLSSRAGGVADAAWTRRAP
jgi:hypothetical protein